MYLSLPEWRWHWIQYASLHIFHSHAREYDPLLKWAFESKVSLILVDQNLCQHNVQMFKPSAESSSFQKPQSDMNVASGCLQFAKLSVLDEGNYVQNDVMSLKCIVDTSKIVHNHRYTNYSIYMSHACI